MAELALPTVDIYKRGLMPLSVSVMESGSISSVSTTNADSSSDDGPKGPVPIAICGMATRLPGGISSPEQLWDFLVNKGDACDRIPAQRYTTHGPQGNAAPSAGAVSSDGDGAGCSASADKPHWKTHGYMLSHIDLAAECFENAGETRWRGENVGVYIGSFGEDWNDIQYHDRQDLHLYKLTGTGDFVLANRISYEYNLKGPSLVLRTGCSAALHGLHVACQALQAGEIPSALVGGSNLIMNPSKVETMFNTGVLSKGASSRSFDASADGYARGEAVSMIYVKRLDDAIRDGNPIRAVIRATASNCDGRTLGLTKPSSEAHESLIRASYSAAGLENEIGKTGFFECHATGTASGDPEEAKAVANIFGDNGGVYIGSVKPNLGHSEGASGLTSLLKCILALENKVIPPNIKFHQPNPNIPFEQGGLRVPTDAVPWPQDRHERTSINSFGVGGANAHVILDSAASFGIGTTSDGVSTGNRLLAFTANDCESARRGSQECSRFIASHPGELDDAAYTLGLRRQHLSYRTFAIVNKTDVKDVAFLAAVKTPAVVPSVVFVFTGQGAQWPAMGSFLLSEHPAAIHDLQLMEKSLSALGQDLAPSWTLSEELMRPKGSSQVYKAEFSQPLCTAVQIVVVNLLRGWGIVPAAVIGHSSGEIAAAYACGALTMHEAIICAYLRGRVTRQSTETLGAMAVIGLGPTDIKPYLVDGIVIACENSPSSTTLSGDEDKIMRALQAIKDDHPDVLARHLQVDMAYHSHHMKSLGQEYERQLAPHLSGKTASLPFFSTVTSEMIPLNSALDAAYWRSNLESPVLFNTGVERLLKFQGLNSVLVEVGPHSALSGPLRQILSHLKAQQTSYVPTLVRNEDDSKALLSTAGRLFCKGIGIRFDSINPIGRVLTNLPSYPWNHDTKYWYESRVSREYRGRLFPHHPIIGSRVVEASQVEPNWRNLLRLDSIPWCRDHKIASDVVFPGTGYLAMAGEAMRQLSGAQDVALRQVTIGSALILGQEITETILSMRPRRLTNTLDSPWHEFTISSYDETSNSWTKHCSGLVRAGSDQPLEQNRHIAHLPREVDPAYWYKAMRGVGLNYGPQFQGLGRISTHLLHNVAVADLRLEAVPEPEPEDSAIYYFHPATSDACLQLLSAAAARGQARSLHRKAVPTYIGEAYFKSPHGLVTVEAAADVMPNGSILGNCVGVDDTKTVVMQLKDVKLMPIDDGEAPAKDPHAGGRVQWKPDIDFQDASRLIHSHKEVREAYYRLQNLLLLCCIAARDEIGGIKTETTQPHLAKFQKWVSEQVEQAERDGYPLLDSAEVRGLLQLAPEERSGHISQYLQLVLDTEYATIGRVVYRVYKALGGILRGDIDGLEILRQDDALTEIYNLGNQWDYGPWLRLLSHRTPHLRILEIGAGTGATTDVVLRSLDTFYSYVYTDVSAGFFPAAKERFGHAGPRMHFQTLDISSDPLEQGFKPGSFDLIIAANVLHVTPKLRETLANVRKLLRPNGRLLLQEMYMTVKWVNFIMGLLPGWWLGEEDGRRQEPYVSPQRWTEELLAAGFLSPEASVFDDEVPFQINVTMIASPNITWRPEPAVYLLSGQPEGDVARRISTSLQNLGLEVEKIGLSDKPQGAIISILDLEGKSLLQDIAPDEYAQFKDLLSNLAPAEMLWLTRPSQIHCSDPQYAGILGLLRVVRNEISARLCTLELDDTVSPNTWQAVFNVYQKIRRMRAVEPDELADPDCEFAYSGGTIYIPRFHWISVADELAARPSNEQLMYKRLEIGKRGSLKTLQWVERPLVDDLTGEEVYVDVRAVGMNFKDTLIAMGIVNGPIEAGDAFGLECSGVVRAVGPEVTDLSVGDRVMAITCEAYATTTRTAASRCIKMPDDMGFEEAAGMPCIYITVIHGLVNLARLEKGQTVLIHSACGGIGLATIYVCQMIGVDKIYATVGSAEKVQYLIDTFGLPRSHIFSSRDSTFLPCIMRETCNRGVDVVLNSLSGELLHASWKCVAEFGSMVEIGKRDFIGQGRLDMESFEGNRAFFGIEMWPIITKQPQRIRKLRDQFMGYYRAGALKPIRPIRVFDAADIESAIRTMQKGQHIGKLIVRMPKDASSINAQPARPDFSFRSDASYLLVGGLGGLGRSIAIWMVEHGAKHFIFLSRSGGKRPDEVALVRALEGAGCSVSIAMGSVTEIDDVNRAVDQARLPIAGVVQLSMVLRDQLFARMPFEDWEAVTKPKIQGTWNLHTALAKQPLDFFVLFSSFAGLIGQRGQANYAAASTFLDAFVQFRHGLSLPASVLDVGAVADVGFVAERPELLQYFKTTSHHLLREQDVLDSLELAIRKSVQTPRAEPSESFVSDAQVALAMRSMIPLSSPHNRNVWRRDARLSLYHNLEANAAEASRDGGTNGGAAAGSHNDEDAAMRRLLGTVETDPNMLQQDAFVEQLAQRIGVAFFSFMMKPVEELDIMAGLATLGIDSLVAIELRNWLRLRLNIEMSVLEIMRSGSILGLARSGARKWAARLVAK
ncbi:acyl transferase domain-containing protein [Xylariaceae sp. FL0662B]|nr:acyl transferase domain-containing protein [Xylariaceae sp. FL0662B]